MVATLRSVVEVSVVGVAVKVWWYAAGLGRSCTGRVEIRARCRRSGFRPRRGTAGHGGSRNDAGKLLAASMALR